ncbi:hypothetical protein ECNE1487_1551, partial [Escherichia coli NE1487]
SPDSGYK